MGGAQFFWRVTLVEGRGRDGVFKLEECSMPLGEPRPMCLPYQERSSGLTYKQLVDSIPYVGPEVGQRALRLSTKHPQTSYNFSRYMAI